MLIAKFVLWPILLSSLNTNAFAPQVKLLKAEVSFYEKLSDECGCKITYHHNYDLIHGNLGKNEEAVFSIGLTQHENYQGYSYREDKFADGSKWLLNSASDRKSKGYLWAQQNYNDLTSNSTATLDFYFVCHSQGYAYAAGIAEYLKGRGHNIVQLLFLSCHQGFDIEIDQSFTIYQMLYCKFVTIIPGTLSGIVMDLVVGDEMVKGAKYGIIIRNDLESVMYLHGSSNSSDVFPEIKDLQDVYLIDVLASDGHTYTGQSTVSKGTLFYSLNKTIVQTNLPGFNP